MPNYVDAAAEIVTNLLIASAAAVELFDTKATRFEKSALAEIGLAISAAAAAVEKSKREHDSRLRSMVLADQKTRRAMERRAKARDLRAFGLTFVEMGKRLGVSAHRARELATDEQ